MFKIFTKKFVFFVGKFKLPMEFYPLVISIFLVATNICTILLHLESNTKLNDAFGSIASLSENLKPEAREN